MVMKSRKKMTAGRIFDIANAVFMTAIVLVMLYPFWYLMVGSISSTAHIYSGSFLVWPDQFNFASYRSMLGNIKVAKAFLNSIFITIVGTAISMTLTFMGAYVLSKPYLPGRTAMTMYLVFTMLFGGGLIPFYLLVKGVGLIDTIWALIIPTCISTYNMVIMRNFLMTIPLTLEEAARIDGANHFYIMLKVYLPLSAPVLATVTLFYAVGYWNSFFYATIFLNDSTHWTLQVLLREYINAAADAALDSANTAVITENAKMALIIITSLPIIVVYPFLQKYFVKGMLVGSVKG